MTTKRYAVWTVSKVSESDIIEHLVGGSKIEGGLFWTKEEALAYLRESATHPRPIYLYRLKIGVAK